MIRRRAPSPASSVAPLFLGLAAAAAGLAGCGDDPRALVDAMGRAYRAADHYADDARVRVVRTRGDGTVEEAHPFRVAFQRPDRLRIDAYDARIVADGRRLRAAVGGIPGQVLAADVESPLALDQLFADRELQAALTEGEAGCPTQLPLLLADDTIDLILGDATGPPRLVGTETIDGHACGRIAVPKPDGTLELWIDRRTKLLRRMQVPTDAYAELLSRQAGAATGVSVVVDFVGASFAAPVPEAFTFEVPAGAREVQRLEPLPAPRPLSPLVGRRAEAFSVTGLDGRPIDRDALAGGPAVIEFFFSGCEAAGRTMPLVAAGIDRFRAARQAADRPAIEVRHLSVSLDDADVGVDALRKQLAEYGGVGGLARDPRGAAAESLGVRECPAAVILAADGTVADVIEGEHARIDADVAATLATLADGGDATRLVRDRQATRLREYTARLARAAGKGGGDPEPRPEPVIPPRRQPLRFKLARAWRASGVSLPGHLVCLDESRAADEPRVVVLDGWRDVVELDARGAELGRHRLAIPEGAAVRYLRTAVDGAGRRWWLGGARDGRQVFVFDADWRLQAAWPPAAADGGGVSAAALLDLDGDGAPEIVTGQAPSGGVQAATLAGRRLWPEPAVGPILDLAPGPPGDAARGLWCLADDGRIVPVSLAGRAGMPAAVGGWRLRSLVAAPLSADGGWAAIGIAASAEGRTAAVGIAADGAAAWELPLAAGGRQEAAVEPIAWADLLGTPRRQWLVAAADGAVTVAWADGGVVDTYHHGAVVVGIGGFRHAGGGFVVLATRTAVEAFRVEDVALD